MGLFKRGKLEEAIIACKTCEQETPQKYLGQDGTPWQPKYYYRCGCGTMNISKIRLRSEEEKSMFQKIYKLLLR